MNNWNTKTFVAIGSLAALQVVLNLPGALAAGVTGLPIASAILNVVVIGIMFSLVPLILRRTGAVTLWALIFSILALPLPIAAPPGFLPKIPYLLAWGVIADVTYYLFKRSDKFAAIAISVVQVGFGGPIAFLLWTYLGAPQLAAAMAKFFGWESLVAAMIMGAGLGYLAYFVYTKISKTAIVQRIQS